MEQLKSANEEVGRENLKENTRFWLRSQGSWRCGEAGLEEKTEKWKAEMRELQGQRPGGGCFIEGRVRKQADQGAQQELRLGKGQSQEAERSGRKARVWMAKGSKIWKWEETECWIRIRQGAGDRTEERKD